MSSPSAAVPVTISASGGEQPSKPKVRPEVIYSHIDEKSARDDCMLMSRSDDPAEGECKSLVEKYKACMAGYGFQV
ncbi:Cytochrome c oxidase copper chaperone [Ascosphaera aggregata]|nr:Cytochrome c oxidase copper chaperone [Ascosphaera aggregata]